MEGTWKATWKALGRSLGRGTLNGKIIKELSRTIRAHVISLRMGGIAMSKTQELSKTAENERLKLRAAYWNNIAVGLLLAGLFIPLFMRVIIRMTLTQGTPHELKPQAAV